MSLLTFAKTALGSMIKQPVTVCYPQEKLAAPERLRGHIVNDMDVCICCGMCARRCAILSQILQKPKSYFLKILAPKKMDTTETFALLYFFQSFFSLSPANVSANMEFDI